MQRFCCSLSSSFCPDWRQQPSRHLSSFSSQWASRSFRVTSDPWGSCSEKNVKTNVNLHFYSSKRHHHRLHRQHRHHHSQLPSVKGSAGSGKQTDEVCVCLHNSWWKKQHQLRWYFSQDQIWFWRLALQSRYWWIKHAHHDIAQIRAVRFAVQLYDGLVPARADIRRRRFYSVRLPFISECMSTKAAKIYLGLKSNKKTKLNSLWSLQFDSAFVHKTSECSGLCATADGIDQNVFMNWMHHMKSYSPLIDRDCNCTINKCTHAFAHLAVLNNSMSRLESFQTGINFLTGEIWNSYEFLLEYKTRILF